MLKAFETGLSEGIQYERRVFYTLFSTEDQKEAAELSGYHPGDRLLTIGSGHDLVAEPRQRARRHPADGRVVVEARGEHGGDGEEPATQRETTGWTVRVETRLARFAGLGHLKLRVMANPPAIPARPMRSQVLLVSPGMRPM